MRTPRGVLPLLLLALRAAVAGAAPACIQFAPVSGTVGYSGSYLLYLDPTASATTNVSLSSGTYSITFAATSTPSNSASVNVTVNGTQIDTITVPSSPSPQLVSMESRRFLVNSSVAIQVQLKSASASPLWVDNLMFEPYSGQAQSPSPPPALALPRPPPYPNASPTPSMASVALPVVRRLAAAAQAAVQANGDALVVAALTNATNVVATNVSSMAYSESVAFYIPPPVAPFYGSPLLVVAVFTNASYAASAYAVSGGSMTTSFCGINSASREHVVVLGNSTDRALARKVLSYSTRSALYAQPSMELNNALERSLDGGDSRADQFAAKSGMSFIPDGAGGYLVPFTHNNASMANKFVRVCVLSAIAQNSYANPKRRLAQTAPSGMSAGAESASVQLSSPTPPPPTPPPGPPPTLLTAPLAIYSVRNTSLIGFGAYSGPLMTVTNGASSVDVYQFTVGAALTLANGVTTLQAWLAGTPGTVTTWYDQSTYGRHATGYAAVGGAVPTVAFLTFNQTAVYFKNQSGYMKVTATVPAVSSAWITFTALTSGATGTTTLFGDNASDISLRLWPGVYQSGAMPAVGMASGNTSGSVDWLAGINDVSYFYENGQQSSFTTNTYNAQNTMAVSSPNATITVGTIGRGTCGACGYDSRNLDGYVSELIFYPGKIPLTDALRLTTLALPAAPPSPPPPPGPPPPPSQNNRC